MWIDHDWSDEPEHGLETLPILAVVLFVALLIIFRVAVKG